jgi:hypothetical protein
MDDGQTHTSVMIGGTFVACSNSSGSSSKLFTGRFEACPNRKIKIQSKELKKTKERNKLQM